jgi:hypothetical protein
MAKMTRAEVYDVIDGERDYQRSEILNPNRPDMVPQLSVGETIVAIEKTLDDARRHWYHGANEHPAAMADLRKIAGLAVQAGENYGMPRREGF